MANVDFTRMTIDLKYGPTLDTDTRISPIVEPHMLRDAPRARVEMCFTEPNTPYLIRMEVHSRVKYVMLRNATDSAQDSALCQVDWYDDTSGEHCVTSIDNEESIVIPNPRKWDADLDMYGITLTADETIGIYAIEVGEEE